MRARAEWKWTFAVMAAIAGTGLIPGRALALFFGQMKSAAWAGILTASAAFGAIVGMIAWRQQHCGEPGRRPGRDSGLELILEVMRMLFAALVTAMMLVRTGELGALTLPIANAGAFGTALAVSLAILLGAGAERTLPALGATVFALTVLFYACMAMDPRPVKLYAWSETELALAGSLGAALPLALLYAGMNGCAAGWAAHVPTGASRPAGIAVKAGAMLLGLLVLGCLALMRGGDQLLAQAMPWTVLSARWGLAGFWLCACLEYLCAVATLSAGLNAFLVRIRGGGRNRAIAASMLLASVLLFGILSFAGVA